MDDRSPPPVTVVVSDKFSRFAEHKGAATLSEVRRSLVSGRSSPALVAGQGLSPNSLTGLKVDAENANVRLLVPSESRIDKELVHKKKAENVVISRPLRIGEGRYTAQLVVDENCDEMRDHVTGQHVQGMLLIEAARQMMMASVEDHAFVESERGSCAYVLNGLDIRYFQYLFPLPTTINCHIHSLTRDQKGVLDINLSVEIIQGDKCVCSVGCEARGYPSRKLKSMEARMAKLCLRYELKAWEQKLEEVSAAEEEVEDPVAEVCE